ncbi:type II toxin-antitoxin system HicB family antitoxin [Mucilaginibacter sp.]|uniref:type II toxin-antitoxin system HicB family antitoxin n=1 Tax=Mucilaginibacter sp. TaxID=1882438 RepID=UPI0032652BE8
MGTEQLGYEVIITPEDEGGFSVSVPELPGCFTQGETVKEAMLMANDAINLYLESLNEIL